MTRHLLVIIFLFLLPGVYGFSPGKCDDAVISDRTHGPIFDNDPSNQKFREWVIENTDWNWLSELDCIGSIIVSFKVDRRGNLVHPTISSGLEPNIDAAVLQAVKSSPKWEPARKNNRTVSSKQTVEIIVMLK